jgi:N-acetylglutamate synthase-like GNAT family acetyltransferase
VSDLLSARDYRLWLPTVAEYPEVTRQFKQWGQKVKCGKRDRVYTLRHAQQLLAAARVLEPSEGHLLLRNLTVAPALRGQGLARALMTGILHQPQGLRGSLYCYALAHLREFYLSLNFNVLQAGQVPLAIAEPYQRYRERGKTFVLMGYTPHK